ncbi:MAG TPA: MFS transporter [Burkholderiales bacterium]|nr:MFS transporter [Burkholderiales bacterium]
MNATRNWRTPVIVLACGGLLLSLGMGIRHGFGLFLQPMTMDLGWGRETFAFALALQNLIWGVTQPLTGMIADRYGAGRVLVGGTALYVAGLVLMAFSQTGLGFSMSAGLLIGLGLSGTTFSVVLGVVGRAFPPEKRSMALGIAAAAGSFGQFAMLPVEQSLIGAFGWFDALLIIAAVATLMVPLSAGLVERHAEAAASTVRQSAAEATREAFHHRGFVLLTLGFFVCGFQVMFIGVHFPAYLLDRGLSPQTGMISLALIGFFNIIGTYIAGFLGGRLSKKYLLSALYLARSAAIALFLLLPITPFSVYLFAAAIGVLWLATVPLTNALIAQIFGVQYLSMLGGFVFFSHQIGSFLGVWLGGFMFDRTGSYQLVWVIAIALGIVAAILNLPIDEREVQRAPKPQAA